MVLIFEHSVDWSGRCETPAGEGGSRTPRGKRAPGAEINRPNLTLSLIKEIYDNHA